MLLLTPLHWLLLSIAAWRALFQLIYDPQRWEKTEHGIANTSRVSAAHRVRPQPVKELQWPAHERGTRMIAGRVHREPLARVGPDMPIAPMKIMEMAREVCSSAPCSL